MTIHDHIEIELKKNEDEAKKYVRDYMECGLKVMGIKAKITFFGNWSKLNIRQNG